MIALVVVVMRLLLAVAVVVHTTRALELLPADTPAMIHQPQTM